MTSAERGIVVRVMAPHGTLDSFTMGGQVHVYDEHSFFPPRFRLENPRKRHGAGWMGLVKWWLI